MMPASDALVDARWLSEHLNDSAIKLVDASYFVPGGVELARQQFAEGHIPGAVFFDINAAAEAKARKEHAFPSGDIFAEHVSRLGIGNEHHVIAYDHLGGTCAAARVWFMFRAFGHTRVSILNGGRTAWTATGSSFTSEVSSHRPTNFHVKGGSLPLKWKADVLANVARPVFQLLDARSRGRFEGTEPEPRPGLRSGHIPGSRNLPFLLLIDSQTKIWKSAAEIKKIFEDAGVDLDAPLATTCGSGVSACALALGAYIAGQPDVAIYDGSWVEWGADPALPLGTGLAGAAAAS